MVLSVPGTEAVAEVIEQRDAVCLGPHPDRTGTGNVTALESPNDAARLILVTG